MPAGPSERSVADAGKVGRNDRCLCNPMDTTRSRSHTARVPGAKAAVQIADSRNRGRYLRVSWHPSRRTVIVSQWRDGVCVATTPIGLAEIPALVGLLVQVLHDAASAARPLESPTIGSVRRDIRSLIRSWLRPRLAAVLAIASKQGTRPSHEDPSLHEQQRASSG